MPFLYCMVSQVVYLEVPLRYCFVWLLGKISSPCRVFDLFVQVGVHNISNILVFMGI